MKKVSKAKATVTARDRQEYIQDKMGNRICVPKPKSPKSPNSNEPLIQFIVKKVNGQRRKVGVIVARLHDTGTVLDGNLRVKTIRFGWSRTNFNKGDVFNKEVALNIAMGRAMAKEFTPVCHSFKKDIQFFWERCQRYFKDATGSDIITFMPQTPMPQTPKKIDTGALYSRAYPESIYPAYPACECRDCQE